MLCITTVPTSPGSSNPRRCKSSIMLSVSLMSRHSPWAHAFASRVLFCLTGGTQPRPTMRTKDVPTDEISQHAAYKNSEGKCWAPVKRVTETAVAVPYARYWTQRCGYSRATTLATAQVAIPWPEGKELPIELFCQNRPFPLPSRGRSRPVATWMTA